MSRSPVDTPVPVSAHRTVPGGGVLLWLPGDGEASRGERVPGSCEGSGLSWLQQREWALLVSRGREFKGMVPRLPCPLIPVWLAWSLSFAAVLCMLT